MPQLYIVDADTAQQERMSHPATIAAKVDPLVMKELAEILGKINPFAIQFKNIGEVQKEEQEKAKTEQRPPKHIHLIFNETWANWPINTNYIPVL